MKPAEESLRILNGVGFATRVGGSRPIQPVIDAMRHGHEHFFEMDDLLSLASRTIANETGAEAGLVTCGAAAALTLGAAAILARNDLAAMEALPDISALPRAEIIYPIRQRFDYDHAIRASGARMVEFDFCGDAWEEGLAKKITPTVAGVAYVWTHRADATRIARIAAICRTANIPFLLDGAMALPPAKNLRELIQLGPTLIALSGGKHLGGPQNSGILFGRKDLVTSAWLQMVDMHVQSSSWSLQHLLQEGYIDRPPRHGIGRGFKVGKDVILGCLAALRLYPHRDFKSEGIRWEAICHKIVSEIGSHSNFRTEALPENSTGQYPVVRITAKSASHMAELKKRLKAHSPKIILAEDDYSPEISYLYPICLNDDEVDMLIPRLADALTS